MTGPADTLVVRRHLLRSRVVGGRPSPSVGSLVDRAMVNCLAAVTLPARDGHGVWLIRRLNVSVRVGAEWPPSRIARALAAGTARALAQAIEGGPDGENVIVFRDRPAFLARFMVDSVIGRAAGRWEYREFAPDDAAPSAVLLTAIEREPENAIVAFGRLSEHDLRTVLGGLAPADADAVLAALATATTSGPEEPAQLVVAALVRLLHRSALPEEPSAAALTLYLDVARHRGSAPPAGSEARARQAVRLRAIVRGTSPSTRLELAGAIEDGRWASGAAHVAMALPELASWPNEARRSAFRVLVATHSGAPEQAPGLRSAPLATSLGGMFLLLPLLEELPWGAMTEGWPELDGVAPTRIARLLSVAGALGAHRNPSAALDPVLRMALGVPTTIGAPAINAWSRGIGPEAMEGWTRALVAAMARSGKASGHVTLAPLGDRVVAVDGALGMWLGTAPGAPAEIRALAESLEAGFGRPAAVAGAEPWIEACLPSNRPRPDPIDGRLLFRLGPQARYATLGEPFELSPDATGLFMVAAQALGRELARRLPGFSRSSLPYLSDNVLQFEASIEADPDRFVVRVGDPPLHLLLSLTGLNRQRFRLEASGDREWVLTQER
jgi:hypothetical protein